MDYAAVKAECLQWKEYAATRIARCTCEKDIHSVLQELNAFLADRVHIAGGAPTQADQAVYQQLHVIFRHLTFSEKERYQHVSRWLDHMQRTLTTPLQKIHFLRTPVYVGGDH